MRKCTQKQTPKHLPSSLATSEGSVQQVSAWPLAADRTVVSTMTFITIIVITMTVGKTAPDTSKIPSNFLVNAPDQESKEGHWLVGPMVSSSSG